MVIVDEKQFMPLHQNPPPPYIASPNPSVPPPPFPHHQYRQTPTLPALPSHILLKIVYMTFPQTPGVDEGRIERQRKTLYWLEGGLRLVNRAFYVACMHVLRSTYLPAYDSLIRAPYTSDPFPISPPSPSYTRAPAPASAPASASAPATSHTSMSPMSPTSPTSPTSPSTPSTPSTPSISSPCSTSTSTSTHSSPTSTPLETQRETQVLDFFIALKVREDVWMDDSELHLEREESFKDLFDLMQPRSRLEDLVRFYGVREGVVCLTQTQTQTTQTQTQAGRKPIPFSSLSISFSPRTIGLVLSPNPGGGGRKRTIVQVARSSREEKLEYAAKRLVKELGVWLAAGRR